MDESWRMRIGMPILTSRRRRASKVRTSWTSAEAGRSTGMFGGCEAGAVDAEDFNDVFGGPPRSVLNRKLSCDFSGYDYFYNDIFRRPEEEAERSRVRRTGRRLPEFRIPSGLTTEEKSELHSDTFGSPSNWKGADNDRRETKSSSSSKLWRSMSMSRWNLKSKSKSKSNSSSVLSYEEISHPIRSGAGEDDVALASYAAKLRPINVPCRWNSSSAMGGYQIISENQYPHTCYTFDNYYQNTEYNDENYTRNSNSGFSQQFPSPETETDIPYSTTVGIPVDDFGELESPSSANSTFYHDPEAYKAEEVEYLSSYVIELDSRERGMSNEAADIDEAIAWAKGKYQGCCSSSRESNVRQSESTYQF